MSAKSINLSVYSPTSGFLKDNSIIKKEVSTMYVCILMNVYPFIATSGDLHLHRRSFKFFVVVEE